MPKLDSLIETVEELDADVCFVTETWLTNSSRIEQRFTDLRDKLGYGFIRRDRPGERPAGGVGILFKESRIQMMRIKVPPSEYEIVAAIGRRTGQRRKVLAIAMYIPPWYDAAKNAGCLEHANQVLRSLRNKYVDPYVMIGGDMNRREIKKAVSGYPDMKPVITDPTRGRHVLDIIMTNMTDLLKLSLIHI